MKLKLRHHFVSMIGLLLVETPVADFSQPSSSNLTCSLDSSSELHSTEHMLILVGSHHQRVPAWIESDAWNVENDIVEESADTLLQRQGPGGPGPPGVPKGKGKAKIKAKLKAKAKIKGKSAIGPIAQAPINTPEVESPKEPLVPEVESPKEPLADVAADVTTIAPAEVASQTTTGAPSETNTSTPPETTINASERSVGGNATATTTTPNLESQTEPARTTPSPLLKGAAKKKTTVADAGAKDLPPPRAEKLRNLAEGVMSVSNRFDWDYMHDGDEVNDGKVHAQKVFNLEEQHLKDGTEPTTEEMVEVEEAETDEFDMAALLSAESSEANHHLLTAHDLGQITHLPGMEDIGPNRTLQSFEGDMVPADDEQLELFQKIAEREQTRDESDSGVHRYVAGAIWPGGRVNYCFASDTPARVRHMFVAATRQYKRAIPCLSFSDVGWLSGSSTDRISRQACKETPAIFVQSHPHKGCYSYVGMVRQLKAAQLQLQDPGCMSVGTAVHELGHALGMAHEQSRPDRDTYIRVDLRNVKKGRERNFHITPSAGTHLKYDYLSVMHYDAYAFAIDRSKPTLYALNQLGGHDATQEIGQRMGLSNYDVDQLALAYRGEFAAGCSSNAFAGLGCINRPGKNGEDVCSSQTRCRRDLMKACCACGGGYKVQCYEGHPCPKPKPLPPESDHACIVNKANLFPEAGYSCVIFNRCFYPVEWQCPAMSCKHQTPPGVYRVQTCNGKMQTDICRLGKCNVKGLFANKSIHETRIHED